MGNILNIRNIVHKLAFIVKAKIQHWLLEPSSFQSYIIKLNLWKIKHNLCSPFLETHQNTFTFLNILFLEQSCWMEFFSQDICSNITPSKHLGQQQKVSCFWS